MNNDPGTHGLLIEIARSAIDAAVRGARAPAPGDAPILREQRGAFVTIRSSGRLRGCIGRINADDALAILLPAIAVESATGDPRFPPVSVAELPDLHIEISLLSVPVAITGPAQIEIGRHGIIVSARGRRGLLLPQVATEYGWTADEFLSQACAKASLPHDEWKRDGVRLQTFETEVIG